MNQKVYFAGSIRGGREDAQLYHDLIEEIKKTDIVLTEHVGIQPGSENATWSLPSARIHL